MSNQFDRDMLRAAAEGFGRELALGLVAPAAALEEGEDDSADKPPEEIYRDRNLLSFALCRAVADAHGIHNVGTYEHDEWAVVAVRLPTGLASWHVRPETVPEWLPERDPEEWFDGHTREMKNRRVERYANGEGRAGTGPDFSDSKIVFPDPEGDR